MVPQGRHAYYTSNPDLPCQTHLPQPPQVPYMQSASSASFSEPSTHGPPVHQVPIGSHHGDFGHSAGPIDASAFTKNEAPMPCTSQEKSFARGSSPPPPAYPPGFEPKHENAGCVATNAAAGNAFVSNVHTYPYPEPYPQPHQQPRSYDSFSNPHLHDSYLNPHTESQIYPHPHPPAQTHPQPQAHAQLDPCLQQHQHQLLQTQPPHLQPHPQQHQSSRMTYPTLQVACQEPTPHPSGQVSHTPVLPNFDGSGVVIGVPMMGTPVYMGPIHLAPPPEISQYQQPVQNLQPQSSDPKQQPRKSTYYATKYYQRSVMKYESQLERRNLQERAWHSPAYERGNSVYAGNHSRSKMGRNFSANTYKANVQKSDDKQLLFPSNGYMDQKFGRSGSGNNFLHKVSSQELNPCGRQLQNTQKANQSQANQILNFKATLSEENCMPGSYCTEKEEKSYRQPLRFDPHERSSLASACSKAQSNSLVECEQEGLLPEASGETAMEHEMRSVDSKIPTQPYTKKMSRWLEERRNKYPTPANIQRKAEEKRKQEQMEDCFSKRPRHYLPMKDSHSGSHYRREKPRIYRQRDSQGQFIDRSQMANTDCEGYTGGQAHGLDHRVSGPEMPLEIEDSGPIESPYQGQVSDLEKGIQEENPQCVSENGEFTNQVDKEKIPGPCSAFVFRRKRRKQKGDRSALGAQRQKKLLFKLLDRDLEKENSYFLQCCRFLVNNHFLQDMADFKLTCFSWTVGKEPSDEDNTHVLKMETDDTLAIAAAKKAIDGAANHPIGSTHQSVHEEEKVHVLEGAHGCENVSRSTSADCEKSHGKEANCPVVLPTQELGCSNEEEKLLEDANMPTIPVEEFLIQEASCAEKVLEQMSSRNRELMEEAPGSTMLVEKLRSGMKEGDLIANEVFTKSSSQLCENSVCEVHPELTGMPHNHPAMNGFVDAADPSLLLEPSCAQYEKEVCPWRHPDRYNEKDAGDASYYPTGVVTDSKHAPTPLSASSLDSQGPISSLWEQSNTESHLPIYDMNTDGLGSGACDSFLGDDDDILQYMNFDAFETDSGMCYS